MVLNPSKGRCRYPGEHHPGCAAGRRPSSVSNTLSGALARSAAEIRIAFAEHRQPSRPAPRQLRPHAPEPFAVTARAPQEVNPDPRGQQPPPPLDSRDPPAPRLPARRITFFSSAQVPRRDTPAATVMSS